MRERKYARNKAVEYAGKWAYSRNPKYYNFDLIGGDCTSFVSQCIFAGSNIMNYTKDIGWYYINGNNKSPSWTGVEFLHKFLVNNRGIGPYGKEINQSDVKLGDVAQLSFDGQKFVHTLIIINVENRSLEGIKIASHTFDNYGKSIAEYTFQKVRFIQIEGVRE